MWLGGRDSALRICWLIGRLVERGFLIDEPTVASPQDEVEEAKNHRGVESAHVGYNACCAVVALHSAFPNELQHGCGADGPLDVSQTFPPSGR